MKRAHFSASAGAAFVLVAGLALTGVALAKVKAPPLPPGSQLVRVEPGANPAERKRSTRAHHHKGHIKKNVSRDDRIDQPPQRNEPKPGKKK